MTSETLAPALEYAALIERVHGENHPELTRVRELTEQIGAAGPDTDLRPVFAELRTVTDDYAIPGDVCETFEAVYRSLQQADDELTN